MPDIITDNSILTQTKKMLGIADDYEVFDLDVLIHINSAFSYLSQIGIGPVDGYAIINKTNTWNEFLQDNKLLNMVKSYVYLQVRLWFDPPTTSFDITAKETTLKEMQWRLSLYSPPATYTEGV